MAITLDASSPVAVDDKGSTVATAVTASFSPPDGSYVAIAIYIGFSASNATAPTVTVADSLSNSYTAGPAVYDTAYDGSYQFSYYYASAPGAVTVTATRTVTAKALFGVVPYVLTGVAADQTGAGSATGFSAPHVTGVNHAITTTTTGSWTLVVAGIGNTETTITPVGLTTDHSVSDTTDVVAGAVGHVVTGTPGSATLGWTVGSSTNHAWTALEILPGAAPGLSLVGGSYQTFIG